MRPATAAALVSMLAPSAGLAAAGPASQAPVRQVAATEPEPDAEDRQFDLDITQRRITRADFRAGTAVQTGSDSEAGFSLRVGAMVMARRIDVVLRDVRGHVRFHGDLGRLKGRLSNVRRVSP